ncbi:hypothetical protein Mmc1_3174 [Magnetococcus marinus MC-1]|uniref:DUF4178 domain-containing protein n=1 Tax=Magnetococcus marinus (strain ATCC BAA-1437 / JCM 17883 / MC-1) TaxID=156889 RepID=A0LCH1_MAGMM|nr:DUF4178 domain-containing protein [Magnetococcus marinus]ABK45664.1 hypothetical protein Mmc1_3174 [Magnetococcus marinus MC-1]
MMDSNHLVLLILVAGAGFYIYSQQQRRTRRVANPKRALTIQNVGAGGVVALRGVGPDLEDLDLTILGRHSYDEDGYRWFELQGDAGNRTLWLSVEDDDTLEVCLTLRKEPLAALGVAEAQLRAMQKAKQGSVQFEGQTYHFDEAGKAIFYRNEDRLPPNGEAFHYWEFLSEDEQNGITVEQWGNSGNFECHIYQCLRPAQYTVYALEGSDAL